jgi:hypothetical protein
MAFLPHVAVRSVASVAEFNISPALQPEYFDPEALLAN